MAEQITRRGETVVVSVDSVVADSEEIAKGDYAGGNFTVLAGTSTVTITFYRSKEKGGTYTQMYDKDNAALSRTVAASRSYPLPDEVYGVPWLKLVGDVDGTVEIDFAT